MKKLSLTVLCILFSLSFFASCSSNDEEIALPDNNSSDNGGKNDENQNGDNEENGENNGENGDSGDTGSDTAADTAADTGSDTGTDTGADTGADSGTDTGADSGADSGDSGTDTGADSGADSGDSQPDTDSGDSGDSQPDTGDTGSNPGDDSNLSNSDANQTAQAGKPGASCTNDSQCNKDGDDQDATCLTSDDGFPGGYCTFISDMEAKACSKAQETHYGYNSFGDGYCYHRCSKPSDCRKGYRCSNKVHACMPDCKKVGYVCSMGECDETDGVCLKSGY